MKTASSDKGRRYQSLRCDLTILTNALETVWCDALWEAKFLHTITSGSDEEKDA